MTQHNIILYDSIKHPDFITPSTNIRSLFKSEKRTKKIFIYKSEILAKELYDSDVNYFKNCLEEKTTYNELIELGKNKFPNSKQYLFQRLINLKALFDSEEGEEISLDSLKGLLLFLFSVKNLKKPVITLNDMSFFQTNWKKDKNNLLTISFIKNYSLNYVIFRPSRHTVERIIFNGAMNVLDFRDYLITLGVKLHKEKK